VLHTARWKCRTQNITKNSPSRHHSTTLLGYIFATKALIDNRKKNSLNSDVFPTCPRNMVNFSPLAAGICWRVWGTPSHFTSWQHYCMAYSTLVSQKNVPPLICYTFDTCECILMFFGRNVTDKGSNQKMLYCATSINVCFCTSWQTRKHENCMFFTQMLYQCIAGIQPVAA